MCSHNIVRVWSHSRLRGASQGVNLPGSWTSDQVVGRGKPYQISVAVAHSSRVPPPPGVTSACLSSPSTAHSHVCFKRRRKTTNELEPIWPVLLQLCKDVLIVWSVLSCFALNRVHPADVETQPDTETGTKTNTLETPTGQVTFLLIHVCMFVWLHVWD